MNIVILGAGPAGLYCALLLKKAHSAWNITILERNPADVTYGWGVVFSDRTLSSFQRADYKTYEQIAQHFVIWDAIDVHYRDEIIRCGGHVIASISRQLLLNILQERCKELGITLRFNCDIHNIAQIGAYDLLIAADGINSVVRKTYAEHFKPTIAQGNARYIWLGTDKVLDAFTFLFRENAAGLFQVHAYPFSGTTSTFIVECTEEVWHKAGLDTATEQESLAYSEELFAQDLQGAKLFSNNSKWISFPTLKTRHWHYQNIVLLGDAVHTAHFSIGSGTKLAMEDAIALAGALEQQNDIEAALNVYELERKPVVEIFQKAAQESQLYFETLKRYLNLEPMQFTFQLLTRSGRITYDDLRLRDPRFGEAIDRWYATHTVEEQQTSSHHFTSSLLVAPPPLFAPLQLRQLTLPNRVALVALRTSRPAFHGTITTAYLNDIMSIFTSGSGLIITDFTAVSSEGRITPYTPGLYENEHLSAWKELVRHVHSSCPTKVALHLGHAGRRGATQPREYGMDRPLTGDAWQLIAPSPLPYASGSQIPHEMTWDDMERVREAFVQATQMAQEADFDQLQLNMAHGYLLASFLSPLTNQRSDEYGGDIASRLRFPLAVFDAVRTHWPEERPLIVSLNATDGARGGLTIEEAIQIARTLKEHGCDLIHVEAGQTTEHSQLSYARGFLTSFSDRIRNEAGIATLVGGYLTTSNEINTILAAGRADLCLMQPLPSNTSTSALTSREQNTSSTQQIVHSIQKG